MAENKDLVNVLWSGADVLRGKMDANEYKTYLLGLVFYKYLSDKYLETAYDLYNGEKPESMTQAQEGYEAALNEMGENDKAEYLNSIRSVRHYTMEPKMTFVSMMNDINNKCFNRENLQSAFNRIQESDEIFNSLFADVDLYSNRLGANDQKQSDTIADVIKVLNDADLIHAEGDVLGNAYEYLIGQFASDIMGPLSRPLFKILRVS